MHTFFVFLQKMCAYNRFKRWGRAVTSNFRWIVSGHPGFLIREFIDEYYMLTQRAEDDPEKILLTITRFVKKLEVAHFFIDGNLRLVRLILLKLLAENYLPLTCMHDPNIIDGFSTPEIAKDIIKGMRTYQTIHHPLCIYLRPVPELRMSREEREDFFTLKTKGVQPKGK